MKDIKGILIGASALLLVIAILVIVIVVLVRRKKSSTTTLPAETDWGRSLSNDESATIKRIADALYKDMKGLNLFSRDTAIYTEYNDVNDRIFVGVANYFADVYGDGETLAEWLKSENYSWLSFECAGLVNGIISRLAKFGIN